MQRILARRSEARKVLRVDQAGAEDYDRVVRAPARVYEELPGGGEELLAYLGLVDDAGGLLDVLRTVEFVVNGPRTQGLKQDSVTVGFMARVRVRHDFCRACAMKSNQPGHFEALQGWAERAVALYDAAAPDRAAAQRSEVGASIRPEWVMRGGIFTSGIVNRSVALRYHRDAGNFPGSWSLMFALQDRVEGGLLALPEYRLALAFDRPSYLLFCGSRVLHGVTPIRRLSTRAYRYTLVYYSLRDLRHCLSPAEELARVRRERLGIELRRRFGRVDP